MSSDKLDYNGLDTLSTIIKDFVLKKLNIEITNVKQYANKLTPTGTIQVFAGNSLPDGWLLCDGSAISRTTYPNLFIVIGTVYGNGDGSTTFNLPNLTDKFIQGNSTVGTVKNAGLPNISGEFSFGGAVGNTYDGAGGGFSGAFYPARQLSGRLSYGSSGNSYNSGFNASRSSSIYGNSSTVQPPALTMRYIIKY